jgi:hypothetical protein
MTTFAVRPEALLDARRVLLRHAEALAGVALDPPATDRTSALTREAFERVEATVATAAADLRALGAGLNACVELAALAEEDVSALLSRLGENSE